MYGFMKLLIEPAIGNEKGFFFLFLVTATTLRSVTYRSEMARDPSQWN